MLRFEFLVLSSFQQFLYRHRRTNDDTPIEKLEELIIEIFANPNHFIIFPHRLNTI